MTSIERARLTTDCSGHLAPDVCGVVGVSKGSPVRRQAVDESESETAGKLGVGGAEARFGARAGIDDGDPVSAVERRDRHADSSGSVDVGVHNAVGDQLTDDQRQVVHGDADRQATQVRANPSTRAGGRALPAPKHDRPWRRRRLRGRLGATAGVLIPTRGLSA